MGHIISRNGVHVDPDKTRATSEFPVLKMQKQVRSSLGMANYYRKFIQDFAKLAHPLNASLSKDYRFAWSNESKATGDTKEYPDQTLSADQTFESREDRSLDSSCTVPKLQKDPETIEDPAKTFNQSEAELRMTRRGRVLKKPARFRDWPNSDDFQDGWMYVINVESNLFQ